MVGSNAEAAEKTAQEIREASGKAIAVAADLTSEEGRAQVLTKTLAAFGKVDILINNAGWAVSPPSWKQIWLPSTVPST